MTPERWQRVNELFHFALERKADHRNAFLAEACAGDVALQSEVESLLAAHEKPGEFIETPASDVAAALLVDRDEWELIGKTVSHYRIDCELGAGGMGVVYRATDLRLGRPVAVKFLASDLTRADDAKQRFIREARSASSLDHPNICTIYDFDETEDHQLFYAMALYEGETLKNRLARERMGVREAVHIATDIARGLGSAHQRGIIHRDIKPANVMITAEGQVKILDFGLAKLTGDQTLTRDGHIIGSPLYMSPEQVRGDYVDNRTDIWSLGVVLYEMVGGKLPFRGETTAAVFHAILDRDFDLATDNVELNSMLRRCLAKTVSDRYASVAELLRDLGALSLPEPASSMSITSRRPEERLVPSIAVLPFVDMSAARDQDYFCEGIAEEILNSLTQIEGVRVASRSSSFQFKGTGQDIARVGERLKVNTVLEGSVRKAGERLRVTVQLINVADGYHLWSKRYDSDLQDVFAIQDEIAENTARALKPLLQGASVRRVKRTGLDAYDYYLRGRKLFDLRERSLLLAREMFERSAECDPNYALAYTGIADCSAWLFMWFTGDQSDLGSAHDASFRALQLAPDLAEAHTSRGWALSLAKQYDDAAVEFEKAIALNPNLFNAWSFYSRSRFAQDRPEEAIRLGLKASEVQPDDYQGLIIAGMAQHRLGLVKEQAMTEREVARRIEQRLLLDPHDARTLYLAAINIFRTGGSRSRTDDLLRRAEAEDPNDRTFLYNAACYYSLVGDVDRSLGYLERAVEGRTGFFKDWVDHDPEFDPMRSDPRFQSLVARLR